MKKLRCRADGRAATARRCFPKNTGPAWPDGGEVAREQTDKAKRDRPSSQIIAGADIAITSWGVPQLDKGILDSRTQPALCGPTPRGQRRRGIVSDEL